MDRRAALLVVREHRLRLGAWVCVQAVSRVSRGAVLERPAAKAKPVCWLCGGAVTEEDECGGCDKFICDKCDVLQPMGRHDPMAHKDEM